MPTYTYPSNAILDEIAQDFLPTLQMTDPLFDIMPVENEDTDLLMWEQEDNNQGLMSVRGINGQPGKVQPLGVKRYAMQPGYYGDFSSIDELEITRRRGMGTFGDVINVDDLIAKRQNQLLDRLIKRVIQVGWTTLTTGTYTVTNKDGVTIATDTFPIQTYSAGTGWSTAATSTPLADFRAVKLKQRGHAVMFNAQSTAYMNQVTFNSMTTNTNASDLFGKRTAGLATIIGLSDINKVLLGEDMPQIVIYDGGYIDSAGTFQPYIANSKVVLVGKRVDGAQVSKFIFSRNAQKQTPGPGIYNLVVDSLSSSNAPVPREISVHTGVNGGPAVLYPNAIVAMSV
jgi:hypothetical protein